MTSSYQITCCSTADLPAGYRAEHPIPYACFHFRMNDREYDDNYGQSIPLDTFYQKINEGAMPTTSQVNPEQYEALFEPILKEGLDIIHITLSSGISGTYNSALIARDSILERYPKRRIEIVDSLCASSGYGLLVDAAREKQEAGMEFEALVSWLMENRTRVHHVFFTSDLSHLRRGGRISASAAFFGTMLNICPVLEVNREGKLAPRVKCRGKKKAMKELVSRMEAFAENSRDYDGKCFIVQSACMEDARTLSDIISAQFPKLNNIAISTIGTVIGSHTGPGTVGLFFWGRERDA